MATERFERAVLWALALSLMLGGLAGFGHRQTLTPELSFLAAVPALLLTPLPGFGTRVLWTAGVFAVVVCFHDAGGVVAALSGAAVGLSWTSALRASGSPVRRIIAALAGAGLLTLGTWVAAQPLLLGEQLPFFAQLGLATFFVCLSGGMAFVDWPWGWSARLAQLPEAFRETVARISSLEAHCRNAMRGLRRDPQVRGLRRILRGSVREAWQLSRRWSLVDTAALEQRGQALTREAERQDGLGREGAAPGRGVALERSAAMLREEVRRCEDLRAQAQLAVGRLELLAARLEQTYGALLEANAGPALLAAARLEPSGSRLAALTEMWNAEAKALATVTQE